MESPQDVPCQTNPIPGPRAPSMPTQPRTADHAKQSQSTSARDGQVLHGKGVMKRSAPDRPRETNPIPGPTRSGTAIRAKQSQFSSFPRGSRIRWLALACCGMALLTSVAWAQQAPPGSRGSRQPRELYVAPTGDDTNPGYGNGGGRDVRAAGDPAGHAMGLYVLSLSSRSTAEQMGFSDPLVGLPNTTRQ